MDEESSLTIWDWVKVIFLITISGAGSFTLAGLIFPFSEGQNGYVLALAFWCAFIIMIVRWEKNAFYKGQDTPKL